MTEDQKCSNYMDRFYLTHRFWPSCINVWNAAKSDQDSEFAEKVEELERARRQIEKLDLAVREAIFIAKTFINGYEDLANSVGVFEAEKASIKTARKQLKALEGK